MDKRVIFAVAGSGKTSHIVLGLDLERRFLLVTYTNNNLSNLRRKIIERFGYFPSNIVLLSYFTFLHSFCFKPFLLLQMRTKGINYDGPPKWPRLHRTDYAFYVDRYRRLYHNRIANLLHFKETVRDVILRIEKYFDVLCVDEVQDFGGYDFDFLATLSAGNVDVLFVGDFYQHTFDTSRDGNKNQGLHDDYEKYKKCFKKAGLVVDTSSLVKSYRCSQTVCDFIREHLGIEIYSHFTNATDVRFLERQEDVDRLQVCKATVKLFYQEHFKYDCYSENWGGSKGADHYQDACVVLNGTAYKAFKKGELNTANPQTRNKLYVACSRPRGSLYLVSDQMFKKFKLA
jgi:DNA helicase II / ATP-dependent DNA helicase PcrA